VSDVELNKLKAVVAQAGLTTLGETMRFCVDRAFDEVVIKARQPGQDAAN
jgi:hypothetical protein